MQDSGLVKKKRERMEVETLLKFCECGLCGSVFCDPRTLPCQHVFCLGCILQFCYKQQQQDTRCPICAAIAFSGSLQYLHQLQPSIHYNQMLSFLPEARKRKQSAIGIDLPKEYIFQLADNALRRTWFLANNLIIQEAAEYGHRDALFALGDWYCGGTHGLQKDKERGITYLEKAAALGHTESFWILAKNYHEMRNNPARAFECCAKAAENGNCDAQATLALFYMDNFGVPDTTMSLMDRGTLAIEWYQKSLATKENGLACNNLGHMYYHGFGCTQSYKEAFTYFQRGWKCGHPTAIHNLARMYLDNKGLPDENMSDKERRKKAIWTFEPAAKVNYICSQHALGKLYKEKNNDKSLKKALGWFSKAATNYVQNQYGFKDVNITRRNSAFETGNCYENGLGCSSNMEDALYYYELAATAGHEEAKMAVIRVREVLERKEEAKKSEVSLSTLFSIPTVETTVETTE